MISYNEIKLDLNQIINNRRKFIRDYNIAYKKQIKELINSDKNSELEENIKNFLQLNEIAENSNRKCNEYIINLIKLKRFDEEKEKVEDLAKKLSFYVTRVEKIASKYT
jgi:hypothetical protein